MTYHVYVFKTVIWPTNHVVSKYHMTGNVLTLIYMYVYIKLSILKEITDLMNRNETFWEKEMKEQVLICRYRILYSVYI